MPSRDLIRCLQFDALRVAAAVAPGVVAAHVVVLDAQGKALFKLPVPPAALLLPPPTDAEPAEPPAGWSFGPKGAAYSGEAIPVHPSRLRLLRTLADAEQPLSAKELNRLAFDGKSNEESVRHQLRKLREELAAGLPDFEGDLLPGEGGYRLSLK